MDFFITYYLLGIIMIPGIIFAIVAEVKVKSAYSEMSQVFSKKGVPAWQIARQVLDKNNLQHITLEKISGTLTDNYDPKKERVALSEKVYDGTDVASIGIALHEVGHAIQHAQEYGPAKVRLALVPVLNISSQILWPLIFIGLLFNFFGGFDNIVGQIFIWLAIAFFSLSLLFSLITLPTEIDASKRAKAELISVGALDSQEMVGASKVLNAAALTYVASLVVSILSLLRFLLTILAMRER